MARKMGPQGFDIKWHGRLARGSRTRDVAAGGQQSPERSAGKRSSGDDEENACRKEAKNQSCKDRRRVQTRMNTDERRG